MGIYDHLGKICPYCKCGFSSRDVIVACSQCDMPHHMDCWIENQRCTTFGCQGTMTGIGEGQTSVTATELVLEDLFGPWEGGTV